MELKAQLFFSHEFRNRRDFALENLGVCPFPKNSHYLFHRDPDVVPITTEKKRYLNTT